MSSFNESVGLGYLKTNAIEFVKYPSHRFMPALQDCNFTLASTARRLQNRLLTYFFGKRTVIYKQSYWRKYWHLIYSSAATGLKCCYILSPRGGSRKRRTHGSSPSPLGLLSQAVHTKNSSAVCVGLRCIPNMMHTCFKSHHEKNDFLSITAATTNVRWAVSTPKGAAWTPVITCLRSSGTPAARWSRSTSRPQVLQCTHDLWPHIHSSLHTR